LNIIFNIANGDYLADQLKETSIAGEIIVCREALVAGPLQAENLDSFWKIRSEYIIIHRKAIIQKWFRNSKNY
jgi:hypothetical protein